MESFVRSRELGLLLSDQCPPRLARQSRSELQCLYPLQADGELGYGVKTSKLIYSSFGPTFTTPSGSVPLDLSTEVKVH